MCVSVHARRLRAGPLALSDVATAAAVLPGPRARIAQTQLSRSLRRRRRVRRRSAAATCRWWRSGRPRRGTGPPERTLTVAARSRRRLAPAGPPTAASKAFVERTRGAWRPPQPPRPPRGRLAGAIREACVGAISRVRDLHRGDIRRPRGGSGRARGGLAVAQGYTGAGWSDGDASHVHLWSPVHAGLMGRVLPFVRIDIVRDIMCGHIGTVHTRRLVLIG